ncbi:hypothetical protein HZY62_15415 [Maribacter polysiphoniae]|uniref:Uncharacterized protein n=1 Tax=Maribacter polysiphoniae TaxID=429344 RepID=A0A316DVA7_9FLAO|nr:hypothetical protein [Maribacter polysiphoniae]MBD1261990.1 hypothetical protein [Maribacter polysiphoniae]PWK21676.1 hypothetical protein LX92_03455 [Maribacter polysiphoniae]
MAIQQTIIGLENNFSGRASVLSRTISPDNVVANSETSQLILRTNFNMRSVKVRTRARTEREISTDFIPGVIQSSLESELDSSVRITRDVSIGAMFTDDLPIGGHTYSNVFLVVSWEMIISRPFRDPQVGVEMYFGWNREGRNMSLADNWYLNVDVSNVIRIKQRAVRNEVNNQLRSINSGLNAGQLIINGLRPFFDVANVNDFYVLPGSAAHNSQESNITVRQDASFWVVE